MSIPSMRAIGYKDDGVTSYQCLSCYNKWSARTSPFEYSHTYENAIVDAIKDKITDAPHWRFCPYCGVKWKTYRREKHRSEEMYDVYDRAERRRWKLEQTCPRFIIQKRTRIIGLEELYPDNPDHPEPLFEEKAWKDVYGEFLLNNLGAARAVYASIMRDREYEAKRRAQDQEEDDDWKIVDYRVVLRNPGVHPDLPLEVYLVGEIERRVADIESGKSKLVPWEEVKVRIEEKLNELDEEYS